MNGTYMYTFLPAPQFRGDFNDDENVDGIDYFVWRSQFGMSQAALAADANGNGTVDSADYVL